METPTAAATTARTAGTTQLGAAPPARKRASARSGKGYPRMLSPHPGSAGAGGAFAGRHRVLGWRGSPWRRLRVRHRCQRSAGIGREGLAAPACVLRPRARAAIPGRPMHGAAPFQGPRRAGRSRGSSAVMARKSCAHSAGTASGMAGARCSLATADSTALPGTRSRP